MKRNVCVGAIIAALLFLILPPALALADAPITRGLEPAGEGSVGEPPTGAGSVSDSTAWHGVQELPPPTMSPQGAIAAPAYARPLQQGDGGNGALAWLERQINPGNWILDAGMGIFAGIVKMFGGMTQKAAGAFLGTASVLPSGCDNAATNFVFCTPASLTYAHPGLQAVWGIVGSIATGLVTILFTVRLGRMIVEGSWSLATESKGLLLTFICSMAFIKATGPICMLLIEFFNGLSNLLLSRASLALPSQDVGDLNIGSNMLFLVLWVLILILVLKGFSRIVQIIILLAMAPIAGALLMDPATSGRFRSWFEKLIELLLSQINLVMIFIVIAAILQPYQNQGAGDAFVGFLLSIVMMGMALNSRAVIGIAGAAMSGGGSYLKSLFMMGALGAGSSTAAHLLGRGVGTVARGVQHGIDQARAQLGRGTADGLDRVVGDRATSGDPAQTAAAQRATSTPRADSGGIRFGYAGMRPDNLGRSMYRGFHEARHNTAGAARRERALASANHQLQTAQAAKRMARDSGDGALMAQARCEQSQAQVTLLRDKAEVLDKQARTARANGFNIQASQFEHERDRRRRQAEAHAQLARNGEVPYRPGRWAGRQADGSFSTNEQGSARREVSRLALNDAAGMHDLERSDLDARIAIDEGRATALPRQIALNAAKGQARMERYTAQGRPARAALAQRLTAAREQRLRAEQSDIQERLTLNRNRRDALTPIEGEQHAKATRVAATAIANERLPEALRIGRAGSGQAELQRARTGVQQIAHRPPSERTPVPPRRSNRIGHRTAQSSGQPRTAEPGAARQSRAPSETIARLRAQRDRSGGSHDPDASDTPRPARWWSPQDDTDE